MPKRPRGEMIGIVDYAFDDDSPSRHPLIRDDSACAIPWLKDGFQAIEVFVDPALTDRHGEISQEMTNISGANDKLEGLKSGDPHVREWRRSVGQRLRAARRADRRHDRHRLHDRIVNSRFSAGALGPVARTAGTGGSWFAD